jgi:hypothetical protein
MRKSGFVPATRAGGYVALRLAAFVVVVAGFGSSSWAQVAHLTLQSEPGDFIGAGGTFDITYTPENSDFFFVNIFESPPTFLQFILGTVTSGRDNTFASLDFGTNQLGIPIQPGFYADAERAAFASLGHPGLDVSFQNRGCNTLTGNFTISEATFTPDLQTITSFVASFEQHCEGATPALFGTFSYVIPEPSTLAVGVGTGAVWLARRRGSRLKASLGSDLRR